MVKKFFKAFKSECRRILLAQHPDLDFSELEKITSNDLAKLAAEDEALKNSSSGQPNDPKAIGEKTTSEATPSTSEPKAQNSENEASQPDAKVLPPKIQANL